MRYQTRNTLANKSAREQFHGYRKGRFGLWHIATIIMSCICAVTAYRMYCSSFSIFFWSSKNANGEKESLLLNVLPATGEIIQPKINPLIYSIVEKPQQTPNEASDVAISNTTRTKLSPPLSTSVSPVSTSSSSSPISSAAISMKDFLVKESVTAKSVSVEISPIEALVNGLGGNIKSLTPIPSPKEVKIQQQYNYRFRPPNKMKLLETKTKNNINLEKNGNQETRLPMDLNYFPSIAMFNNISLYYQNMSATPKGIIFVAHGCKRHYTAWWPKSLKCISCLGLPIERQILRQLLDNNFMFVTASPIKLAAPKSECWHKDDSRAISKALTLLYDSLFDTVNTVNQTNKGNNDHSKAPPLHLMSVSNGVQLVGQMGIRKGQMMPLLPLTSLVILVGGIWEDDFLFPVNKTAPPLPPTLFVDTSRNSELAVHNLEFLANVHRTHGIEYASQLVSDPIRIDPLYFFKEGCALTEKQSRTLYAKLMDEYALWPANDRLLMDPFIHAQGRKLYEIALEALPDVVPYVDDMKYPLSPLLELLIVAYGNREVNDIFTADIIRWMEAFT